jgi:Glycine zipper
MLGYFLSRILMPKHKRLIFCYLQPIRGLSVKWYEICITYSRIDNEGSKKEEKMIKKIQASAVMMALMLGLLFVSGASDAMAQGRNYRSRSDSYRGRSYDSRSYYRSRYIGEREATNGNLIKRTGIGAGIGLLGGALIGGKTGAVIGGAAGAAGGYIYHRKKIDDRRDRIFGRR